MEKKSEASDQQPDATTILEKYVLGLDSRKGINKEIIYLKVFEWKEQFFTDEVWSFAKQSLDKEKQEQKNQIVSELRNCEDLLSCQSLMLLFSFAIPSIEAIQIIVSLNCPIISMGAGLGYWEYLMIQNGVDVLAFDNRSSNFPEGGEYIKIQEGNPTNLKDHSKRALFLCWPDSDDELAFSHQCLEHYSGNIIIHVGEMFGETLSANPWGMSTSSKFQLKILESYRLSKRINLPNWPGFRNCLSIWRKVESIVTYDGGDFVYVEYDHNEWKKPLIKR